MLPQLTTVLSVLLASLIGTQSTTVVYTQTPQEPATKILVEEKVELLPELKPICACESVGDPNAEPRQFDNVGNVIRGRVDPLDTGKCQISKRYWLDMANQLGYDIETDEGNTLMANWIYENNGAEPWKWSKPCWNRPQMP